MLYGSRETGYNEHHNQLINTPTLYLGVPRFKSWSVDWLSLTKLFCDFTQFLQANYGIVPQIRAQSLPSTYFPIHCSLTILAFNVLLRASLNRSYSQTNLTGYFPQQ
jgi:hypothetical protein